ncbi:hypothetical protein JRO89_XS02G0063900 [Xanthoceras sorbifolium]|uniref:Alpha/beta hydrolase fold-3 domain-containing protein n=1 Tax=Xanthoceras sorbifolium TaxID=99658 RepID=A0ABQ8IFJ5_9ROSI|nr:hypothetical protein JRO89_XS02G0063900 [Xanthoceras sorbifolium]
MHHILSSFILYCFLTFSVNIRPAISAVNSINSAYDSSPFKHMYEFDGSGGSSLMGSETVPESKDIVYLPEFNLSARLYRPIDAAANQKLPLLFYIHGGAFITGSPFDETYHNFLNILVSEANVVAVSIQYRLIDVCPLPCAYNDSWAALKWVASHLNADGPEDWLNQHADFQRVFVSGDSAGANIAHQMAIKLATEEILEGFSVAGMILCHPFFWGSELLHGETQDWSDNMVELWEQMSPTSSGIDDPWLNPAKDPNLARVGFLRLQVFVSENDLFQLRERGWYYAQKLRESGWSGYQEVIDFQGENHVFHLNNLNSRNSTILRNRIVTYINQEWIDASVRMKPSRDWSNSPLYDMISMIGRRVLRAD